VVADVLASLDGAEPDLAFLFCSASHGPTFDRIAWQLRQQLAGALLVGCTARSVIGGGREIEGRAGLSLTVARLPGVTLAPIRVGGDGFPRGAASWREHFELDDDPPPHFVLLADPFSCDAESLVAQLGTDFPESTLLGGLASCADRAGGNSLFLADRARATDSSASRSRATRGRGQHVARAGPIGHPPS
jgi:small ligand-binding sensory domain FIST